MPPRVTRVLDVIRHANLAREKFPRGTGTLPGLIPQSPPSLSPPERPLASSPPLMTATRLPILHGEEPRIALSPEGRLTFQIGRRDRRRLPDKADRPGGRGSKRESRTPGAKAKRSIRSAGVGLLLAAGLWTWSCGDGAVQPIAPPARPDSVVVTPESAGLATPGDTVRLRAGVRDQNGFELPGVGVAWTSSAPEIATVDTSGVVTAAGVGSATITATATAAEVHGSAVVSVAPSNFDWKLVVWSYPCFPENGDTPPCEGGDVGGLGYPRGWTSAMRVFSCFKIPGRDCGEWRGWGRSYSVSDPSVLAPASDICTFDSRCPAYAGRRVGSAKVTVTATRDSDRTTQTASVTFTVQSLDHPTMKAVHSGLGSPSWRGWGQDTLHLRDWKGVYASWLGKVSSLSLYEPSADAGPIPIPPAIGDLDALTRLSFGGPAFSGSIPPWLGGLANLMVLRVSGTEYSGSIPPALGGLANLQTLDLSGNQLSGSIPPALGSLSNLQALILNNNDLTGEIPVELVNLTNLRRLDLRGNKLCEPADSAFRAWVNSLDYYYPPTCPSTTFAEVFQVTQQPGLQGRRSGSGSSEIVAPEALLAGRNALLRVAPLAREGAGERVTRQVRVTYRGSGGGKVRLIPEGPYDADLPSKVNFSSLDSTFNMEIPWADVQPPSLEIWVEVWRTLSSGSNYGGYDLHQRSGARPAPSRPDARPGTLCGGGSGPPTDILRRRNRERRRKPSGVGEGPGIVARAERVASTWPVRYGRQGGKSCEAGEGEMANGVSAGGTCS